MNTSLKRDARLALMSRATHPNEAGRSFQQGGLLKKQENGAIKIELKKKDVLYFDKINACYANHRDKYRTNPHTYLFI